MAQTVRPLSPHLSIYRWQVQMVASILHRVTGVAMAVGLLVLAWAILSLAAGPGAWRVFTHCGGSVIGIILLVLWSWALFYHLCSGIRHLFQDAGLGFTSFDRGKHNVNRTRFVATTWVTTILSIVLTIIAWIIVGAVA